MKESIDVYYISEADLVKLQGLANGNWNSIPIDEEDFNEQFGNVYPALQGYVCARQTELTEEDVEWLEGKGIEVDFVSFQNSGQSIKP